MSALEKGYQYGVVPKDDVSEQEETPLITKQKQDDEESGISFDPEQEDQQEETAISFGRQLLGELVGTCMLTQVGCAALCANVYLELFDGLWQVAAIWFLAVMLAVSATASVSGAHLNPAVTLAFGVLRSKSFSPYKIIPYWLAQILGATIAGFINYQIFSTAIEHYETNNVIIRGELNSIRSAKTFGCYWSEDSVRDASQAFYIEAFGTSFLVLIVFCATHPLNKVIPTWGVPSVIGAAVAACVATLGGLTGAGINPARDFGPRLITYFYGWGLISFQGAWVYFVGPLVGGIVGGIVADGILY